jgi:hypothetical protein
VFSSPPIVLAVFTSILLALLAVVQVVGNEFLRQVFNDTGRRSEGRRQRRAFEWCIRGMIGSVNYIFALQKLADLPLKYVPEASTWLTVGQFGLGVIGVAFLTAAWLRIRAQFGYST